MTKPMRARNPTIGRRRRLSAAALSMLVVTACVQSENARSPTAERPTAVAGLPSVDGVRHYDAGIAAVDETRTARQIGAIVPKRADRKVQVDERETQAIAAWAKEEAIANAAGAQPLRVAPPPRPVATLALPPSGLGELPKPVAARATPIEPRKAAESPAERPAVARADPPKAPEPLPVKAAPGILPAIAAPRPEAPASPPPPSVDRVQPATVAAIGAFEPVPPPPSIPPAATVPFARQSAEISGIGRSELDRLAKDANARRLRQMELRAYASDDDPNEARKVALARALAVQSYLVDQGVKARIEVGFWAARDLPAPDRVDVLAPNL
jgi:outer membrane protein OmpA-like peptidoglycan-associated protein